MTFFTVLYVFFNDDSKSDEICGMFEEYIPKHLKEYYRRGIQIPFKDDDPNLQKALRFVEDNQMKIRQFHKVYMTRKELDNHPLFKLRMPTPLELEGTKPEKYGTKYINTCPNCGFGGVRISDVLVDRKFIDKYHLGEIGKEFFVSKELRSIIEDNKLSGIAFQDIIKDYKGRDISTKYVVNFNALPPLNYNTWLCPLNNNQDCGHSIVYCDSELMYDENVLLNIKDFNCTYEHLSNYRSKEVVVSAKVRRVFKENKIRAIFEPVTIIRH